jgi:hypothetical protein
VRRARAPHLEEHRFSRRGPRCLDAEAAATTWQAQVEWAIQLDPSPYHVCHPAPCRRTPHCTTVPRRCRVECRAPCPPGPQSRRTPFLAKHRPRIKGAGTSLRLSRSCRHSPCVRRGRHERRVAPDFPKKNQMHLICAPGSSLHTYDRRHE